MKTQPQKPTENGVWPTNARKARALRALLEGPMTRESLDRAAGASNSPEVVRKLRADGLEIPCAHVARQDCDGKPCRPGVYSLTDSDRTTIAKWRQGVTP